MIGNGLIYKNPYKKRNHTNYRIGGNYMKTRLAVFGVAGLIFGLSVGMLSETLRAEKRGGR